MTHVAITFMFLRFYCMYECRLIGVCGVRYDKIGTASVERRRASLSKRLRLCMRTVVVVVVAATCTISSSSRLI